MAAETTVSIDMVRGDTDVCVFSDHESPNLGSSRSLEANSLLLKDPQELLSICSRNLISFGEPVVLTMIISSGPPI